MHVIFTSAPTSEAKPCFVKPSPNGLSSFHFAGLTESLLLADMTISYLLSQIPHNYRKMIIKYASVSRVPQYREENRRIWSPEPSALQNIERKK